MQDNMDDAVRKNRTAKGSQHGMAKLTEKEVGFIKWLLHCGWTAVAITPIFGVHQSTVHLIKHKKIWRHV